MGESRRYPPLRNLVRPRCDNGSVVAANGIDLVTVQAIMGQSALATTDRYARQVAGETALAPCFWTSLRAGSC
jgi:hypothetical protein